MPRARSARRVESAAVLGNGLNGKNIALNERLHHAHITHELSHFYNVMYGSNIILIIIIMIIMGIWIHEAFKNKNLYSNHELAQTPN